MEADESLVRLLDLFNYSWFEKQIFERNSIPASDDAGANLADTKFLHQQIEPKLARISTSTHADDKSTSSQESLSSGGGSDTLLSPNSVLMIRSPMKLETILSGKESTDEVPEPVTMQKTDDKKVSPTRRRRKGKGQTTKSLSELEFEELKGFMDLGFVFSEEDKNSRLAEIIPALQRFGKEEEENIKNSVAAAASSKKPYLSQAWEDMEYRRKAAEKLKWKINAAVDNEMDMKHQLKFWAHSVASAIK
ncbi:hypothetical protein DCAR_0519318 [Daucus carota subsp. sativus]|uniref:DUF1685 domain-containing protein n=1 Tax=Daucus carota subsp. sativus TaxID=79200 RepID=A0A164XW15_DAUCS|nr:PREDICTED: uncharacterized protein LOC108221284 [Daucus carota subsp. sativus]WOG99962.1 hypothetical protein DCAR_0519318 [Daucus carota subsp. sativus]